MITKPEKIVFETTEDVVDYISKGLPPTKKNFNKVMIAWNSSIDEYAKEDQPIPGKDTIIPANAKMNIDNDTFNAICERVYKNRVRNRNIALGIAGVLLLGSIGCGVSSSRHSSKEDEKNN